MAISFQNENRIVYFLTLKAIVPRDILNSPEAARSLLKELGKEPKSNEQLILAQANSFALVASEIFHKHLKGNILSIKQGYLAPFMVNSSFACELFLKTIHIKNQTKSYEEVKYEHNLKTLFFSLPGKIQKQLQLSIDECLSSDQQKIRIELGDRFRELANSFVEWRYLHEKDHLKVGAYSEIIWVLNALYNSSIDLHWHEKNT